MARRVSGQVVVITGASSGIGRATARAFAEHGAKLVLAARRESLLREAEQECRTLGAEAIAVPTDVTNEAEVEALAERAVDRFGRIDVWFNNAGIGIFGRFLDIPPEAWRRVIDVNLYGYVNGARTALRRFFAQRRGVLINNASIAGHVGQPEATAYVVSKYAIRGLTVSLRQEMPQDMDVHVCMVSPPVVDTPFFQHAANYTGHRIRAPLPACSPEEVATATVSLVRRPREEVVVGGPGKLAVLQHRIAPGMTERLTGRLMGEAQSTPEPSPRTPGSLYEPMMMGAGAHGGWGTQHARPNRSLPLLALGIAALPIGVWAWRQSRAAAFR